MLKPKIKKKNLNKILSLSLKPMFPKKEGLRLTRNEKKTLKLLLENARMTDSTIAEKLRISSQAVGKIRRKLEHSLIESYTVNINYARLGLQTFAIALAKLTNEGLDLGELEVEQKILNDEHILRSSRVPGGEITHILTYAFQDINELDQYFHSPQRKKDLYRYLECKEIFTFSHNSWIKKNSPKLFLNLIESIGRDFQDRKFQEIENFKRKIQIKPH